MAKSIFPKKPSTCSKLCIAATAAAAAIIILIPILTLTDPWVPFSSLVAPKSDVVCPQQLARIGAGGESAGPTFYDDPATAYTIDKPVIEWDKKRKKWLKLHPAFSPSSENRVLVVTGSQSPPCSNPLGDHFLLRFFKNKVDYCRIHGYEIFYNNAFLHPKMTSYWAKIPVIRAAMVAHPEAEWLFWVDSDAIFTDMGFEIPFARYEGYNLVVHGWPEMIHVNRSWVAVNAGVFLMRNCQWSMQFLEVWAEMGPKSPNFKNWGKILRSTLKDKMFPDSDDQSALVYQMLKGERRWRERIYVENEYALHGYWVGIVGRFEEFAAEGGRRRPFVTHFTGCQPCSGEQNAAYEGDSCTVGMERALNFADNQLLRNYGFVHPDLRNSSLVTPLPFH